jgi:hypothetical protein
MVNSSNLVYLPSLATVTQMALAPDSRPFLFPILLSQSFALRRVVPCLAMHAVR